MATGQEIVENSSNFDERNDEGYMSTEGAIVIVGALIESSSAQVAAVPPQGGVATGQEIV